MAFNILDDQSWFECTQLVEPVLNAPPLLYSSSDSNEQIPLQQNFFDNDVAWNEVEELLQLDYYPSLSVNDYKLDESIDTGYFAFTEPVKNIACDRQKAVGKSKSKIEELSLEEMRKHFHMPIMKAAKEMNVGLTLLKKRCRELGIPRWPYRKMKSLNNIIHNVQELGKETDNECVKRELEMLKEHKRMMEENPMVELTERNKKLRQACFKANYKKKRAREIFKPYPNSTCLY